MILYAGRRRQSRQSQTVDGMRRPAVISVTRRTPRGEANHRGGTRRMRRVLGFARRDHSRTSSANPRVRPNSSRSSTRCAPRRRENCRDDVLNAPCNPKTRSRPSDSSAAAIAALRCCESRARDAWARRTYPRDRPRPAPGRTVPAPGKGRARCPCWRSCRPRADCRRTSRSNASAAVARGPPARPAGAPASRPSNPHPRRTAGETRTMPERPRRQRRRAGAAR